MKKRWEDNIKEWTGMEFGDSLRAAEDREGWTGIVATSSVVLHVTHKSTVARTVMCRQDGRG